MYKKSEEIKALEAKLESMKKAEKSKYHKTVAERKKAGKSQANYYLVQFGLTKSKEKAAKITWIKSDQVPDRPDVISWNKDKGDYNYNPALIDQLKNCKVIAGDTFRVFPVLKATGKRFNRQSKIWS